ncbi:MAG: hypothetical protein HGA38_04310 [Candidatus Moranbacteria bacterium]|nr:hypothetical protein [Candidatus Moranbacteria bacterium]
MKKRTATIVASVSIVIAFVALFFVLRGSSSPSVSGDVSSGIVLYYGTECPHCKDVDAFIERNAIAEKVSFARKEVWHDQKNASEMTDRAASCGIGRDQVGVPFLFADGQCYIGTPDVEGYLREKAGIPESTE